VINFSQNLAILYRICRVCQGIFNVFSVNLDKFWTSGILKISYFTLPINGDLPKKSIGVSEELE
jgi:hypothetical protein